MSFETDHLIDLCVDVVKLYWVMMTDDSLTNQARWDEAMGKLEAWLVEGGYDVHA